jgi:hypothetical protein
MKGEPPQLIGVTYAPRTGDAIVLNFCPWCGARIRFDEEAGENEMSGLATRSKRCLC